MFCRPVPLPQWPLYQKLYSTHFGDDVYSHVIFMFTGGECSEDQFRCTRHSNDDVYSHVIFMFTGGGCSEDQFRCIRHSNDDVYSHVIFMFTGGECSEDQFRCIRHSNDDVYSHVIFMFTGGECSEDQFRCIRHSNDDVYSHVNLCLQVVSALKTSSDAPMAAVSGNLMCVMVSVIVYTRARTREIVVCIFMLLWQSGLQKRCIIEK